MADIDEYEMLDQQLAAAPAASKDAGTESRERGDKEHRHRSDKDRKRSHRDRDGEPSKERRHRSSRSRRDDDKDGGDRKRTHRSGSREHRSRPREEHGSAPQRSSRRSPGPLPPPPRRVGTPPEERERREREKELRELDRDTRTVFAYNLNLKADEKDIFTFFSRAGMVEDVRIIMDRNTRRSKGFAYIEMSTRESVMGALALGGQQLMGQTVMVKSSEAEKNLAWEAAQVQNQQLQTMRQAEGLHGGGPCKLHVRNLHVAMSESDVRDIFAPYGLIDAVVIQKDGMGKSQGHGYVTFQVAADATRAIQQLNGLEIAGMCIKVEIATDTPPPGMPGMPMMAPGHLEQSSLEESAGEGSAMRLTADKRSQLMNRLAGQELPPPPPGAMPSPPPQPQTAASAPPLNPLSYIQGILGPASPIPTQCLLLKNMFDPEEETEADWDQDIAADVKEECGKYGPVAHIWVDKASKGFIYVKFGTASAASVAQAALHGRFFAGKQVLSEFQFEQPYRNHFNA